MFSMSVQIIDVENLRNLTFVADEYEINFDKLSEGEEEDQYTGNFQRKLRWHNQFHVHNVFWE